MSNQVNSDAQAYDKEYDAFIKQLEQFHVQRGTTFKRLPRINGKGIDLYLLYVVVTARGGWQKVNSRNEWEDILEDFRLPSACVNSSTALKHVYIRYLDTYERQNFLCEDGDDRTNDGDEEESRSMRTRRSIRSLNTVSTTYNYQQHNLTENTRVNNNLCTDLYKPSPYDRLALSLSCPLPNEHDFAFNMCTLLSNEGKHTLQLSQCPRIVEYMLAHTGVFRDRETQKYFISNYKDAKGKSLVQFWIDSIDDKAVLDLLCPTLDDNDKCPLPETTATVGESDVKDSTPPTPLEIGPVVVESVCSSLPANDPSEETNSSDSVDSRNKDQRGSCLRKSSKNSTISNKLEKVLASEVVDLRLGKEDAEIFHLGRDLGLLDSEGTRISQVLHILRNLSFEEVNVSILANSNTCLRFLMLCICSRWGGLSVGALDTMGNIASEVTIKDPLRDHTSSLLLTTICQGVSSQDRAFVLRSLEVLNKLAMNEPNEDILGLNIEQTVYNQICRFLSIHDIMLLIYTLECLYSLSSMGSASCNGIIRAKGSVQTLISLLTVEAQSYGPEACIGMKVVETVTGVVSKTETPNPVTATTKANQPPTTVAVTNTATTTSAPTQATAVTTAPIIGIAPKIAPEIKKISAPRIIPVEVEEFVIDWVTKNYEGCSNLAIEQGIVYRHFASSMNALGRKQGLNPVILSNCFRRVFGTGVGPNKRLSEDGTEKWHYSGIRKKDLLKTQINCAIKPLHVATPVIQAGTVTMRTINSTIAPVEVVAPLQGSILKAQLSAPLRNSPSPVRTVPHQQVSRNIQNSESTKTIFNGINAEVTIKNDNDSFDSKKVTTFEGILQNGIKDDDCTPIFERKNLLADLLEKTVGGDVLNGVITKGISVINQPTYITKYNGPSNGQVEIQGLKRPATPDSLNSPAKRLAVEDLTKISADSRITLYVSQNGNDGEVLSQGHQVILNQGQQPVQVISSGGQIVNTPQGQMILQRSVNQGNVLIQQNPQILTQTSQGQLLTQRGTQVISHPSIQQNQQIISTGNVGQVLTSHGSNHVISSGVGQVVSYGQSGQKVILQGGQVGQMLGGQVIITQSGGQNYIVQGGSGQMLMQTTNNQNQAVLQGANGQNQVLVQGSHQGQVILQGNNSQGQLVITNQGQLVTSAGGGQTMYIASTQGQPVMMAGNQTTGTVVSGSQGQMLMQSSTLGNNVILTPQQVSGGGHQKTIIILPNKQMVVSNQSQTGQVGLPQRVVQVVSSTTASSPVRTIKTTTESYTNPVSVSSGLAPPPSGPTATPVSPSSAPSPQIPAPQVLASGVARRVPKNVGLQYLCEWRGCNQVFSSPGQVYHHACKIHCPPHIIELMCQWNGCDTMVRKRFSAMTHIHDRHCNEQLLQILALRRQQIATTGKTEIPIPQTTPSHPGYAPNAAFHAIKRHSLEVIAQRDIVEKEGPVTKSIRLTAALILRNLVIYSTSGKKLLKGYESVLANVAISSMESSRTVGQILYDIHLPDIKQAL